MRGSTRVGESYLESAVNGVLAVLGLVLSASSLVLGVRCSEVGATGRPQSVGYPTFQDHIYQMFYATDLDDVYSELERVYIRMVVTQVNQVSRYNPTILLYANVTRACRLRNASKIDSTLSYPARYKTQRLEYPPI
jgi:hypothetical protein